MVTYTQKQPDLVKTLRHHTVNPLYEDHLYVCAKPRQYDHLES